MFANSQQTNNRCFLFPVGNGKLDTMLASVDVFLNTASVYRENQYMRSQNIHRFCTIHVTQIDTGSYIQPATDMNGRGVKDRRGYRVSDTMGLENVGPVLAPFLRTSDTTGTVHKTLKHDDTTTNNNTLTTDLQVRTNNRGSKQVEPDVFPLGEHSLRMRGTSL
jgi:hypothetical protein